MKIAVLGIGMMGSFIVDDLREKLEVEQIFIGDHQEEKTKQRANSMNDRRIKECYVDCREIEEPANLIEGFDVVINPSQYYYNVNVMQATLKAGCHYSDLGGLFFVTLEQLKLFDDFKKAGLNAVIGIGCAPGITNVLSRYAYDQLD